jgi:Protein of unknown function (DUF3592)
MMCTAVILADVVDVAIGALPGVFALLGLLLLGSGVRQWLQLRSFLKGATATGGRVAAVVQEKRKRTARYFTDVEFQTASGQRVQFRPVLSTDQPAFEVGEAVPVLYNPANPTAARVNEYWHLRFWPIFLLVVGGVMAFIGVWVVISYTIAVS